jgi:hypothetical protein
MVDGYEVLKHEGKEYNCFVRTFDKEFDAEIYRIYCAWRYLNEVSKSLGCRGVNIPEGLSETVFCRAMGSARIIEKPANFPGSYDAYNIKRKKRQEVKSTSIKNDLTSFSPLTRCDELYFVDFYCDGTFDGSFKIYKLDIPSVMKMKINKSQTFEDQQNQGRRPRFSVRNKLIKEQGLQPIYSGKIGVDMKKPKVRRIGKPKKVMYKKA